MSEAVGILACNNCADEEYIQNRTNFYSEDKDNFHWYLTDNIVCIENCDNVQETYLSLAVPGRKIEDLRNGGRYYVQDDRVLFLTPLPVGYVDVFITNDGYTTTNFTTSVHVLHDGYIQRTLYQTDDGIWRVQTIGIGNNRGSVSRWLNWDQGPRVFKHVDQAIYRELDYNKVPRERRLPPLCDQVNC